MSILKTLGAGQGYLKAGFLGWQKSGKSYTASLLAIGLKKYFNIASPIAYYDTEGGSEYVSPLIKKETGQELVGIKSRAFSDLLATAHECVKEGIGILIVDSITHPWDELMDSWLKRVNEMRKGKNLPPRKRLELEDWGQIKKEWKPWTDFYLNSPLHIIICGRAGDIWEREENEETGKKELVKTGVKMRVEGQFGYEPSLLVLMEQEQIPAENGKRIQVVRRATVLGDRFGASSGLDGKSCDNPGFDFFMPHIKLLKPDAHTTINTETTTALNVDDDGDTDWAREKRSRAIFSEEIQGLLVAHFPGQDALSKQTKSDLIYKHLKTRSWTQVESTKADILKAALNSMRAELEPAATENTTAPEGNQSALFSETGAPTNDRPLIIEILAKIRKAKSAKALGYLQKEAEAFAAQGIIVNGGMEQITNAISDRLASISIITKKEPATV